MGGYFKVTVLKADEHCIKMTVPSALKNSYHLKINMKI